MLPVEEVNVLPANVKLPVVTCVGSTIVVLAPSVKLMPASELTSKLPAANVTAPVSKSTLKNSPTRKLPLWSTLL